MTLQLTLQLSPPVPLAQIAQDKVWVWADSSPSNFIDCQMVQPALNPYLADIPGIHGADGREMIQMDRPLLRDVPYSESLFWRIITCKILQDRPAKLQIMSRCSKGTTARRPPSIIRAWLYTFSLEKAYQKLLGMAAAMVKVLRIPEIQ